MTRMSAPQLRELKGQSKLVWITAYDYTQAQIAEASGMDVILVGDSLGMTTLGYSSTLPVTLDDMVYHARMVRRGAPHTMMVVDLPFLTYTTPADAVRNSGRLVQEAMADAVKLEGGQAILAAVDALVAQNIPVVGHLGLTPQSVHKLGGYRVQAKTVPAIQQLVDDAVALAEHGVFAIVLEGIPDRVADYVTRRIAVPTIGIGAGGRVDGQVLVFHDCVGLSTHYPKFARPFTDVRTQMTRALGQYRDSVVHGEFPDEAHTYHIPDQEWQNFLDSQLTR